MSQLDSRYDISATYFFVKINMPRPKENRTQLRLAVAKNTVADLKHQAYNLGYIYNESGATGKYLDAIATSEIVDLGDIAIVVIRK